MTTSCKIKIKLADITNNKLFFIYCFESELLGEGEGVGVTKTVTVGIGVGLGGAGSNASRGSVLLLLTITATTEIRFKSTKGFTTALLVRAPAV